MTRYQIITNRRFKDRRQDKLWDKFQRWFYNQRNRRLSDIERRFPEKAAYNKNSIFVAYKS